MLTLPEDVHLGVPCWTGRAERWAHVTVPIAYAGRYDTHVRPHMPGNPISLRSLVRVAAARAAYADYATGRHSRPTNERLAADTGLSVRTVQRADTALRLLGVATEVLRGRQRTRAERFASWRVGDRGRGWASVWVLHDSGFLDEVIHSSSQLSPHPEGSPEGGKHSPNRQVTTTNRRPTGTGRRGAPRRASPDPRGGSLARAWRAEADAPPWARRHSADAWAGMLARPARHGWTARDLNQLVTDWLGTGHRVPDRSHKPIGLLGAMLAWHANFDERPAALDDAREAAERAARAARSAAAPPADATGRPGGAHSPAGPPGPGRQAARAEAARLARRAAQRRTEQAACEAAHFQATMRWARGRGGDPPAS